MKKFTEYNNPPKDNPKEDVLSPSLSESVISKKNSIDLIESFGRNYSTFAENIQKAEKYIEEFKQLAENTDGVMIRRDEVEQILATHLLLVNEGIQQIKSDLQGINEEDLSNLQTIVDSLDSKTNSLVEYLDLELPKVKRSIVENELKNDKIYRKVELDTDNLQESVDTITQEIEEYKKEVAENFEVISENKQIVEEHIAELYENVKIVNDNLGSLTERYETTVTPALVKLNEFDTKLDNVIDEQNLNLVKAKEEIKQVINEVNTIFINAKYIELDRKVERIEEIFTKLDSKVLTEEVKEETKPASNLDRYLTDKSFQQPNPPEVSADFSAVTAKLKFLEQAIGRIAATGPGGGEVNLRWLDDVDRSTIGNNKYLRYNSTKKKFEFATVSGGGGAQANWNTTDSSDPSFILNKPTIPSLTGYATETYVSTAINNLINSAPGTLDTLGEIATALQNDETALGALTTVVSSKIGLTSLSVTTASASGSGSLAYNNTNGVFTFTPPSLSGYLTAEADTLDSVTDRGNTTTNSITVGDVTANFFQLDTTPSPTPVITTGMMAWNDQDKTFDIGLINGVVLQAGQETHMYVKASEAISNGQAVMFAGANGENILVRKYDPSVVGFIPEWFIGVATQNFTLNEFGYVTVFGKVHDINTNAYNTGDILYADNTVVGGLTTTGPAPGTPHIIVAAVTKKSGTGHIMVRPNIRPNLAFLPDVNITSPTNGQVLKYDATAGYWVNAADATGAGGSGIALADLSVNVGSASGNGNLTYNNVTGVFSFTPASVPAAQIQSDWNQTNNASLDYIKNKPTIPSLTGYATETYVTNQITSLINGAPGTLDTLKEIADQLAADESAVSALTSTVAGKIGLTNLSVSTASASGSGSLSYNNTNGVFTFTPPSLSSYLTAAVTSVSGTGTVNGLTLTGTVTSTGSLTLGGTLGNITNSQLSNSTISGVSLGSNLFALTAGTGISFSSGTTYNGSAAITISASGSPTFTNITTTGQIIESFQTYSTSIGSTQPITLDCTAGNIFNITSTVTQNWTAAFTNLAITTGKATNTTLIINQGATAWIPTAVSVNGTSSTINWQGGAAPSGSANKKDVIAFSILQTGASTYLVFGQLVSFG